MPKFDVFISHSSEDKPFVRRLAEELRKRSITLFLDEEQLVPGQPWQEALDRAVRSAGSVLVFIGPTGIGPWAQSEVAYGIRQQITDSNFRVIPVLGPGASVDQLPPLLRNFAFIDLRNLDSAEFDRLEAAVRGRSRKPVRAGGPSPKVFLCHAKEDAARIEKLYYKLQDEGLDPWYDKKNLTVGDDWEDEIIKAIERTDFFAIFLSKRSVKKTGFIQKEIRTAVREYQNRPQGIAFLLPVRLEDCEVPKIKLDANKVLSSLHWFDIFDESDGATSELAQAIWHQWHKHHEAQP
jgi:hypothetical protein